MKTALNIDDSVMQRLREEAARRGTTVSSLVEAGLRRVLAEPAHADVSPAAQPPLPSWHGGESSSTSPTVTRSTGRWTNKEVRSAAMGTFVVSRS